MRQEEIIEKAHVLIDKAMPGIFSKYREHIADYFYLGGKFYDMFIKIELFESKAEIFTQERGKRIVTYRTDKEDVVIFTILDDIFGLESQENTWEAFADKDKESLHYSDDVREFQKRVEDEAFAKAGEPYNEWHMQGIGFFTLDKIC